MRSNSEGTSACQGWVRLCNANKMHALQQVQLPTSELCVAELQHVQCALLNSVPHSILEYRKQCPRECKHDRVAGDTEMQAEATLGDTHMAEDAASCFSTTRVNFEIAQLQGNGTQSPQARRWQPDLVSSSNRRADRGRGRAKNRGD
jgi:hypothetical protein